MLCQGHHDIVRCVRVIGGSGSMTLLSAASDGVVCQALLSPNRPSCAS
jgi:hypothetical protein